MDFEFEASLKWKISDLEEWKLHFWKLSWALGWNSESIPLFFLLTFQHFHKIIWKIMFSLPEKEKRDGLRKHSLKTYVFRDTYLLFMFICLSTSGLDNVFEILPSLNAAFSLYFQFEYQPQKMVWNHYSSTFHFRLKYCFRRWDQIEITLWDKATFI